MEVKVKIFGTGPDSVYSIPKEVMEEVLKKSVVAEWVHLGQSGSDQTPVLQSAAGKLKNIEMNSDGAFATVETLPTPNGKIVEELIQEHGLEVIQAVPMGHYTRDDEGKISEIDITGYSIEPYHKW